MKLLFFLIIFCCGPKPLEEDQFAREIQNQHDVNKLISTLKNHGNPEIAKHQKLILKKLLSLLVQKHPPDEDLQKITEEYDYLTGILDTTELNAYLEALIEHDKKFLYKPLANKIWPVSDKESLSIQLTLSKEKGNQYMLKLENINDIYDEIKEFIKYFDSLFDLMEFLKNENLNLSVIDKELKLDIDTQRKSSFLYISPVKKVSLDEKNECDISFKYNLKLFELENFEIVNNIKDTMIERKIRFFIISNKENDNLELKYYVEAEEESTEESSRGIENFVISQTDIAPGKSINLVLVKDKIVKYDVIAYKGYISKDYTFKTQFGDISIKLYFDPKLVPGEINFYDFTKIKVYLLYDKERNKGRFCINYKHHKSRSRFEVYDNEIYLSRENDGIPFLYEKGDMISNNKIQQAFSGSDDTFDKKFTYGIYNIHYNSALISEVIVETYDPKRHGE